MKILMVCPTLPYPPYSGESIRTFNLIKYLSVTNEIEMLSIKYDDLDLSELKKYCRTIHFASSDKPPKLLQIPQVTGRFFRGIPFDNKHYESREFGQLLYDVTSKNDFDIIQFEHSTSAGNLKYLSTKTTAKTVLTFHNISFIQFYRLYKQERKLSKKIMFFLTWFPMLSWEPKIAEHFDQSIVVSEVEKNFLKLMNSTLNVAIVPNGVDTTQCKPYPYEQRELNMLYVGSMAYEPNVDAAIYLVNEILPIVKKRIPDMTLTIVGSNPTPEILQLDQNPTIRVKANVADVSPYYKETFVSVVPLRAGGGSRLKILESMAFGTPVVSTSLGSEGLDVKNQHNIFIADTPKQIADSIVDLYHSPKLWGQISENARTLVEKKYDWQYISKKLEDIYKELLAFEKTKRY